MKNLNFKKIVPHIIAVVIFLAVAVVYCKPAFEGKVVQQHDTQGWRGMSQQSQEFKDKYGYFPLWNNSMFSGMPAYQIAFDPRTKVSVVYTNSLLTLGLPVPVSFFFLACICFYFFCIVAGINPWIGILGALSYAYSTFDPIIVAVGHNTQMMSLGLLPGVLAGILLLFQKKYWAGFAVTSLFSALLIGQNHLQIVYYTLLIAVFLSVAFIIKSYKEKNILVAIKAVVIALIAGVLGLACNAVSMMPTYEYAKESMRGGKSELTIGQDKKNKTKGGLDKDYAFTYSVGIAETFTLIVPSIYGGSNGGQEYNGNSKFVEKLTEAGLPEENAIQNANYSSYWGKQQPTSGPVYLGAIICFLFIFGCVYVKGWIKWWLLATSIFGILLAWGNNFQGFNYFLFDHLPFYNKFRAPCWGLVLPQVCFPFLSVLAINKLINETDWDLAWKKLRLAVFITGGILLIACGFYFSSSFTGSNDKELKDSFSQSILRQVPAGQQPSQQILQQADELSRGLITALHTDRRDLMGGDLLKTILLIAVVVVLIGLFIRRKINPLILIASLIILSAFDLLNVDKRYLSSNNFIEDTDFESAFIPTEADQQISKDSDHANFRVFNEVADGGPFNDSRTSYHHNSIGGYHPAKLGLYQDLIENQISKGNMQVFDMLNTKYFIVQNPQTGKPVAQINPGAFGNCWLVKGIKWVNNANEEMTALDNTDLKDTAVIDKSFQSQIKQQPQFDTSALIRLKENANDKILYESNASAPQLAVFSEIYYPYGWNVFVDGQKSDYVKVNYTLRGMSLPAGKHEIEFRFEPTSFTTGRSITIWSNIIVILSVIAAIVFYFRKKDNSLTV